MQELAGHVCPGKIARAKKGEKELIDLGGRLLRIGNGLELPMRQDLALVGVDQQYALLTFADLVAFRVLTKVDILEVHRVVKLR